MFLYFFFHLNTTVKLSFTFPMYNEFIGPNGMAVCYMYNLTQQDALLEDYKYSVHVI
jgi:hypothetical protein